MVDENIIILSDTSIINLFDDGKCECFMSSNWKKSANGFRKFRSKEDAIQIWAIVDEQLKKEKMLETNTLVRHKEKPNLGICCTSKIKGNKIVINVGIDEQLSVHVDKLELIAISHCKTKTYQEFKNRVLNNDETFNYCIVGNELKHFVGIGWITKRVITESDLSNYPRIV